MDRVDKSLRFDGFSFDDRLYILDMHVCLLFLTATPLVTVITLTFSLFKESCKIVSHCFYFIGTALCFRMEAHRRCEVPGGLMTNM